MSVVRRAGAADPGPVRRRAPRADAAGAVFEGSFLNGANLSYADLRGADLRDTCLRGADLTGAALAGADFTGADVTGATISPSAAAQAIAGGRPHRCRCARRDRESYRVPGVTGAVSPRSIC
ncbi:MAG TPA: pentapeptide repeat-containing protein [Trebonia sp.]|jgi:hypothetical protein|nr:pentapeptide repeat-containing protein [Trebonia sp.]